MVVLVTMIRLATNNSQLREVVNIQRRSLITENPVATDTNKI